MNSFNIQKAHEWLLSIKHREALAKEDFETAQKIQDEVNMRIENKTINIALMDGFRNYDPLKGEFYGEPHYDGLNGLFDKYKSIKT
jgi:hypothetical protein